MRPPAIPSLLHSVAAFFLIPESPRWLDRQVGLGIFGYPRHPPPEKQPREGGADRVPELSLRPPHILRVLVTGARGVPESSLSLDSSSACMRSEPERLPELGAV